VTIGGGAKREDTSQVKDKASSTTAEPSASSAGGTLMRGRRWREG